MKLLVLLSTLAKVAMCGHVAVRMPFLNPAGVTYAAYGAVNYDYGHQQAAYDQTPLAYQQAPLAYQQAPLAYQQAAEYHQQQQQQHHYQHIQQAPAALAYAQVPVKAAVAVPTVHHVPAVADVPVTKVHAQPAVVQKVVDVAKPALKTRKFEVRRPAIQKQFYDIEEHIIVRPVGSALVELDEPLSKAQKGPAIVSSLDGHHHEIAAPDHHVTPVPHLAVADAHHQHHYDEHHHQVAYAPEHEFKTVAITPVPHLAYAQAHHHHHEVAPTVAVAVPTPSPYLHKQEHVVVSSTYAPEHLVVSSTPAPYVHHEDDAVVVNARLAHAAEHDAHFEEHNLGNPEAQANQQKLIELLTANGGVAEVGFSRHGYSEHVGDAGLTRARVLSATPSPHHEPVEEQVKTRRIVVSRPVHTLQEIDVVEPVTKVESVAVNQPAVIKTTHVGVQRVHTSVPVYGKTLAPAVAHAQVPVALYHH